MRNRKWNFSHQTFPENTTVSHFDCLFGFKFLQFCFIRSLHADTTLLPFLTTNYIFPFTCWCMCYGFLFLFLFSFFFSIMNLLFAFQLHIFSFQRSQTRSSPLCTKTPIWVHHSVCLVLFFRALDSLLFVRGFFLFWAPIFIMCIVYGFLVDSAVS